MAVMLYWDDDEQTILRFDFEANWTWEDYYRVHPQAREMALSKDHTVYKLVDIQRSTNAPPNALTHLRNLADKQEPNAGITIFVTRNRFLRVLYQTGMALKGNFAKYYRVASTIEEAYDMIADAKIVEAGLTPEA
ncbi:MAG: hypothetical protein OHK0046_14560 [Anaerolineae bacterium]